MTLLEIRAAVLAGKRVFWGHRGYEVKKQGENWNIVYGPTGYTFLLAPCGVMECKEEEFFCE